jgi:hypothetical protein
MHEMSRAVAHLTSPTLGKPVGIRLTYKAATMTEPHGVVGFRVILGALVAGRKGGDRSSIAGWFE